MREREDDLHEGKRRNSLKHASETGQRQGNQQPGHRRKDNGKTHSNNRMQPSGRDRQRCAIPADRGKSGGRDGEDARPQHDVLTVRQNGMDREGVEEVAIGQQGVDHWRTTRCALPLPPNKPVGRTTKVRNNRPKMIASTTPDER